MTRPNTFLGSAALCLAATACTNSEMTTSGTGGTTASGSGGSQGGSTGTGGSSASGGALTNAQAGAACTQNCCLACGIDSPGEQTCTCTSHKYASCASPLPSAWTALGGECGDSACLTVGGPCSPQGYASSAEAPQGATVLDGQPCVMNGNVCLTAETDGKHGCVCASDPSGDFVMRCGLVNGRFSNNGMPTTY